MTTELSKIRPGPTEEAAAYVNRLLALLDGRNPLAVQQELVIRYRMRMIVAQPGHPIPAYDQDRWAVGLRYIEAELDGALRELAVLRRANLDWLDELSEEELNREGIHEERGAESVRRLVELVAAHDLVHRDQIERIKAVVLSNEAG